MDPAITGRHEPAHEREQQLVDRVLASFADAEDDRFRAVIGALVRHLHAFTREVRLTEAEWSAAVSFLTACGDFTDENRQEFILLSDVLGLSMQVVAVNAPPDPAVTESTVLGPFFVAGAPEIGNGGDLSGGASGQPCWVEGVVRDTTGQPVAGARLDVWESDDAGLYDVQHADGRVAARGFLHADAAGRYAFWALTPTPYPIPSDGPVGRLVAAGARSPMRAPHLHFRVSAAGCRTLTTHIFVEGAADYDSVFGVRESLIRSFVPHGADEPGPDGRVLTQPWASTTFDVVLARADIS